MAEQLYTIQVSDYSNCTWPHYFVHIESPIPLSDIYYEE